MPVAMSKRRDEFIDEAVVALHTLAKDNKLGGISKETLAFIIQRYVSKYKPTPRPRPANRLRRIK